LATRYELSTATLYSRIYTVCIAQGGDEVVLKFIVILCHSHRAYSYN